MAHPNIDARRAQVQTLLDQGVPFTAPIKRAVAAQFGCSVSAIAADVQALAVSAPISVHVSHNLRRVIRQRDQGRCQYCGRAARFVEHIVPRSLGGPARAYNLVIACQSCTTRKSNQVWVPQNLDSITADHPAWRARILAEATG